MSQEKTGHLNFKTHLKENIAYVKPFKVTTVEKSSTLHHIWFSAPVSSDTVLVGDKEMQYESVPLSLLELGWDIWMGLTLTSSKNTREFRGMWVAVSCCCHGDVGD